MNTLYSLVLLCTIIFTIPAQEKLELTDTPVLIPQRTIIEELYKPLGITIDFFDLPAERSFRTADTETFDGHTIANPAILQYTSHLILVPEYLYKINISAFVKKGNIIPIRGWKSINSYRVGFVRGHKIIEINTKGFERIEIVNDSAALFKMLENDRIDIALSYPYFAQQILELLGFSDIIELKPPVMRTPMHTYLHKKNINLLPQLNKRIREMRESGRIEALLDIIFERK